MKMWPLSIIVLSYFRVVIMMIQPNRVHAQQLVCNTTTRCGLFRRWVYTGVDGTTSCHNRCVFTLLGRPIFMTSSNYHCGTCRTSTTSNNTIYPLVTDRCDNNSRNSSSYDICLKLLVDPQDVSVYLNARHRWSRVIQGDVPDVSDTTDGQPLPCGPYPTRIDDLYVCGVSKYIDGPGKILGYSAALYVRDTDLLPVVGIMIFDSADIAKLRTDGSLQFVILHEMGHIIGLSYTTWSDKGVETTSSDGAQCNYTGAMANNEYYKITGCNRVPLELDGGSGTACTHWDEYCLRSELMTGYLDNSFYSPLSRITVGSLDDLGYQVDYSQADTYTTSDVNPKCLCNMSLLRRLYDDNPYQQLLDHHVLTTNHDDPYHHRGHHRGLKCELSTDGLQIATEYGQTILQHNIQFYSSVVAEIGSVNQTTKWTYQGHQGIVVYYIENDTIHDVWVTPP